MSDFIALWGETHGFEVKKTTVSSHHENNRQNVILTFRNGCGKHVALNGHLDTVSVAGMTIPPWDAEVRDERIWGRGSADMKGPLASMLLTLLRMKENAAHWKGTVSVICFVDEELGFGGAKHYIENLHPDNRPDFVLVGEPTEMQVVRGCKGCLRFSITAHGKAAHSSTPEKGNSAITAMAHAILALNHYFANTLSKNTRSEFGSSTGSIGIIQGGTGINIVPDQCSIQVDIRLIPGQNWETTWQEIQQTVLNAAARENIRWEFDPTPFVDLPMELPAEHPLVQIACEQLQLPPIVVNYSCDASKFAADGIPTIILGPGNIAQAHTKDESIAITDLESAIPIYQNLLTALLQ